MAVERGFLGKDIGHGKRPAALRLPPLPVQNQPPDVPIERQPFPIGRPPTPERTRPRRRPHPTTVGFLANAPSSAGFTCTLRLPLAPSPPRFSGGEGRGEVVLIKTPYVSSRRINLWFVGSNVHMPANGRFTLRQFGLPQLPSGSQICVRLRPRLDVHQERRAIRRQ